MREANQRLLLAGLREQRLAERATAMAADLKTLLAHERFLYRASALFAGSHDYRVALRQVERLALPHPATKLSFRVHEEGEPTDDGEPRSVPRTGGWDLIVPLRAHGAYLGSAVVGLDRPPGRNEQLLFEQLAGRAAISIDNGRLLEQTRAAVRVRDELLAVISHDFGNPLAAVRFSADAILAAAPVSLAVAAANTIRLAERQMAGMIADLVDLAQLQAGKMLLRRRPQDAAAMVQEVFQIFEGLSGQRQIALSLSGGAAPVSCDRERVLRLLGNLVGNAIKFAPDGTRVGVLVENQAKRVLVSVSNQGWNFSRAQRPHLFEAWAKVGSRSGSGLGLYIAKGIVEAHGGEIWLAGSGQGRGAITFSLPRVIDRAGGGA